MRLSRLAVFTMAALLPMSVGACSVVQSAGDSSQIVIGADLELSGADAAIGTTYQRALQLKIDQINAAGGADGHPLRLVIKDNHSDPTVSVGDVSDLMTEPGLVGIVIGACSECAMAVATTINDKQIPTISLAPADVTQPADTRPVLVQDRPELR